jgi:hypothetical protein
MMMMRGGMGAALAGLLAGSCQSGPTRPNPAKGADWTPRPAPDLGAEVARVGGRPIFAAEVAGQSARFGLPPAQALAQLIDFELLAERARDRAPSSAPAVTSRPDEGRRQLLVERLLEQEFEPGIRREDVPEADLRKVYDQNLHRFVHPRLVEVALLSVYTGPTMKPEPRARAEVTAHDLWEVVSKSPLRTAEAFEEIAKDKVWSDRKVAYWHLIQGPDRKSGPFGANVGGALQKLRTKGETSPLIIDDSGFHIARYIDEKPPLNVPFAQARAEILAGYHPVWRHQRFVVWTTNLGNNHGVEVFPDRLLAAGAAPAP